MAVLQLRSLLIALPRHGMDSCAMLRCASWSGIAKITKPVLPLVQLPSSASSLDS
jgi:hypothetical protein